MLSTDYYPTALEAETMVIRHGALATTTHCWEPLLHYEEMVIFSQMLRGIRVLDVGCGYGGYAGQFSELRLDYTGIDLSAVAVAEATKRSPGHWFEVMSFRNLRLDSESVDGLWCCHSFVNTPKRYMPEVLEELYRVLTPKGTMAIIMPHIRTTKREAFIETDEIHAQTGGELWSFTPTPASMITLCGEAGFITEQLTRAGPDSSFYLFSK